MIAGGVKRLRYWREVRPTALAVTYGVCLSLSLARTVVSDVLSGRVICLNGHC